MVPLPSCPGAFLTSVLLLALLSEARGDCGPPKVIPNTELRQEPKPSYPVGTRLTYACISGYEFVSGMRPVTECLPNSEWSEVSVTCQGKRCPIPNIENGRIVEDSELRLGDRITFACDEGYRPIGRNGARCVLRNNQVVWDNAPPHCQRIPCRPPPTIANGVYEEHSDYTYGTAVTYRCASPFSLIGDKTIVCISDQDTNGKWSGPAPECKVVSCRTPEVPNGVMQTSYRPSYTYQDRVIFECKPGFKLKDNRGDSSCGADSNWQPALPECILDIPPTSTPGGDTTEGTSGGPTVQSSVASTVRPMEETTEIEIAASTATNHPGNNLGYTEAPEYPTDVPGSSISVPVIVGISVGVLAVIAITASALAFTAYQKRQGKTFTGSAPKESYTEVPHNTNIPLEEKA